MDTLNAREISEDYNDGYDAGYEEGRAMSLSAEITKVIKMLSPQLTVLAKVGSDVLEYVDGPRGTDLSGDLAKVSQSVQTAITELQQYV